MGGEGQTERERRRGNPQATLATNQTHKLRSRVLMNRMQAEDLNNLSMCNQQPQENLRLAEREDASFHNGTMEPSVPP